MEGERGQGWGLQWVTALGVLLGHAVTAMVDGWMMTLEGFASPVVP